MNNQFTIINQMNLYYQNLQLLQNSLLVNNLMNMAKTIPSDNLSQQIPNNTSIQLTQNKQEIELSNPVKVKSEEEISEETTTNHQNSNKETPEINSKTPPKRKFYYCEFPECKKKFTANYNKKIHYRSHTNERPFQCANCDRTYYDGANYKYHLRTAHKDLPDSDKKCCHDKCDQAFKSKKQKLMHHSKLDPECASEKYRLSGLMRKYKDTINHLISKHKLNKQEIKSSEDYEKLSEAVENVNSLVIDKQSFEAIFGNGLDLQ